jgi:hypothetical protein
MTESRDRAVEVQNSGLEELAGATRLSLIETNSRVRDLIDPNLPFDLKRQRLAAEFAASAFHLAVALEMISPEPELASVESAVEIILPIADRPLEAENHVNNDDFIEDFCSKNKFSEREKVMIKKIYQQQVGFWFNREHLDFSEIESASHLAIKQAYNVLTTKLVSLGFLESNGLAKRGRKYKISDKFSQK